MTNTTSNIVPLRGKAAGGRTNARAEAQAEASAASLRDLRALVECACWLAEQDFTVTSAATVTHGTLVLRGQDYGVEIRRPMRGPAITVAWRPGIERRLDGGNIGRQQGARGAVYIWQAEHQGVRIYWTTKEGQACV